MRLNPTPRRSSVGHKLGHSGIIGDVVAQFHAKPAEIRTLFDNQLNANRATDLRNRMLTAGLPI
jgi:hypothetical protein